MHRWPVAIFILSLFVLIVGSRGARPADSAHAAAPRIAGGFVVNSKDDDVDAGGCEPVGFGDCTLREAIEAANANGNPGDLDVIMFDIAANPADSPVTIVIGTGPNPQPLPFIVEPVHLDGLSQHPSTSCGPGGRKLLVEITTEEASPGVPVAAGNALWFMAGSQGSVVQGLVLRNLNSAIRIQTNNIIVSCNNIGTDATGLIAAPNLSAIEVAGGNPTIGGPTVAQRNIISGNNSPGIHFGTPAAINATVENNYIGLGADGDTSLPNHGGGIRDLGNGGHLILKNVISGNASIQNGSPGYGIYVVGATVLKGNRIGTNAAGTEARPNDAGGVSVFHGTGAVIGGLAPGDGNLISGNGSAGVWFDDGGAATLEGNLIGTDITGNAPLPNQGPGLSFLADTGGHIVGNGADPNGRNVISGNTGPGIALLNPNAFTVESQQFYRNLIGYGADGVTLLPNGGPAIAFENWTDGSFVEDNRIHAAGAGVSGIEVRETVANSMEGVNVRRNSISSAGGLAIDLRGAGEAAGLPTPNDPGDADGGPNSRQNFPEITAAVALAGGTLYIEGVMNTEGGLPLFLDIFANGSCDASGFGDTERFIKTIQVGVPAGGSAVWGELIAGANVLPGESVTATASLGSPPFNTSEAGPCKGVEAYSLQELNPPGVFARDVDVQLELIGTGFLDGASIYVDQLHFPSQQVTQDGKFVVTIPGSFLANKSVGTLIPVQLQQGQFGNSLEFANPAFLSVLRSSSDVTCDGLVTVNDVAFLLEVLTGMHGAHFQCPANADKAGEVDLADAMWAAQEVAGLVEPLESNFQ